jgi:hypothetical protein
MDVVMFGPRKHWSSVKDSTYYRTPMFTWTKHNDIHAFSVIAPFTELQCLRGPNITTSIFMLGSRKHWGSVKGVIVENAWMSLCLVHVNIGVL